MTDPRRILRGTTYLVTRRTSQRQFLLKPSTATTDLLRYLLAVAARRHGIQLHAFCVLSNHYHLVLTDPDARLPAFGQYLDSLVARALNASYGRWEAFWAPSTYSAVVLASPEDVVEKAAYTLANPVQAFLVARGAEWPGLWSDLDRASTGAERVERPATFFSATGTMPDHATLELVTPPGFATWEAFRDAVLERLAALQRRAAAEMERKGGRFLGARRILRQRHTDQPSGVEPRRGLKPLVAARDRWKRVEVLGRTREFLQRYREARLATGERIRNGAIADVLFPPGTYLLRVSFGVRCAEAG